MLVGGSDIRTRPTPAGWSDQLTGMLCGTSSRPCVTNSTDAGGERVVWGRYFRLRYKRRIDTVLRNNPCAPGGERELLKFLAVAVGLLALLVALYLKFHLDRTAGPNNSTGP